MGMVSGESLPDSAAVTRPSQSSQEQQSAACCAASFHSEHHEQECWQHLCLKRIIIIIIIISANSKISCSPIPTHQARPEHHYQTCQNIHLDFHADAVERRLASPGDTSLLHVT
jgi:hypothetical protein